MRTSVEEGFEDITPVHVEAWAAQLRADGVEVHDVGANVCTVEDERFFSHRRQGDASGRFAALAVLLLAVTRRQVINRKIT